MDLELIPFPGLSLQYFSGVGLLRSSTKIRVPCVLSGDEHDDDRGLLESNGPCNRCPAK